MKVESVESERRRNDRCERFEGVGGGGKIEENGCCEKVRKGGCMSSLDEMNEMNH